MEHKRFFTAPDSGGAGGDNTDEKRDRREERDEEDSSLQTELLRTLPQIRRARGFRLYTEDGRRLTDLWQSGGQAVLGHTPVGILRELKNAASRGLFAPLPSCYESRLLKALTRLFPGKAIRLYAGDSSLRRALALAGYDAAAPFLDPAFPAPPPQEKPLPLLWRPFLEAGPFETAPLLVPALPLPLAGVPQTLVLDKNQEAAFPPSGQDYISPAILAATTRSLWDLIAALPERNVRKFPRLRAALKQSPWTRRGIYLTLAGSPPGVYAALFRRFLANGFLLPPSPRSPLILPGEMSPGEEAALALNLTCGIS
jgi:hypothetical protein